MAFGITINTSRGTKNVVDLKALGAYDTSVTTNASAVRYLNAPDDWTNAADVVVFFKSDVYVGSNKGNNLGITWDGTNRRFEIPAMAAEVVKGRFFFLT